MLFVKCNVKCQCHVTWGQYHQMSHVGGEGSKINQKSIIWTVPNVEAYTSFVSLDFQ